VARDAAGGVGRTYAICMTAFDTFLVLFVATWMFLEYIGFKAPRVRSAVWLEWRRREDADGGG